jgi:transcriptional regulator with XRE-family HTH domain
MTAPASAAVEIDGAQVRERRKLLGENLVSFADKCGIGFQYLSQIERGDRPRVSPPTFARICDALGVKKDDRHQLVKAA